MRSQFAQALVGLFDDAGFYTREEWARVLGITPSSISRWVNDKTLPRADLLAMVLDILRLRGGERAEEVLKHFDHVAVLPATEVSPLGERMTPNVASYVEANSFATLGSQLRGLSREQQRAVLREGEAGSLVHERKQYTPGPWHYQEESDRYTHIVRAGDRFLCQLAHDTSGEAEANARLMAASPDLLKALSDLVDDPDDPKRW